MSDRVPFEHIAALSSRASCPPSSPLLQVVARAVLARSSNSCVEKRPGKGAPETPSLVANGISTVGFAVRVRKTRPQRQWGNLNRTTVVATPC